MSHDRLLPECPDCMSFEEHYADIERCTKCGLGRTVTVTRSSDDQNYLAPDQPGQPRVKYFQKLFRWYFRHLPPGRALDVGCARGEFVREFARYGWTAHGLDAYHGFPADEQRFFRADLAAFTTSERYDVVTMIHSFEHLADPIGALARVRELVRPAGMLLIVVPNVQGLWSRQVGRRWDMLNPEEHPFHYTPAALRNVLHRGGFSVTTERTYSAYSVPSPWQVALSERQFYERGFGAYQPVRSLVFRVNRWLRPLVNRVVDWRNDGAEIHILSTASVVTEPERVTMSAQQSGRNAP